MIAKVNRQLPPFGHVPPQSAGTVIVIVPPLPLAVNPPGGLAGGGEQRRTGGHGIPAIAVMCAVTPPPTPPEYRNGIVQGVLKLPLHLPLVSMNEICRNTLIELGAPAALPAESSRRTTNE